MKYPVWLINVIFAIVVVDTMPETFFRQYTDEPIPNEIPIPLRLKRSPQRAMMFTGYYGRPTINRRMVYIPEGAMTAFTTGDALSTGYLGQRPDNGGTYGLIGGNGPTLDEATPPTVDEVPPPIEEPIEETISSSAVTKEPELEEAATHKIKTKTTKRKQRPQKEESDEDEEDYDWPFPKPGRSKVPSYNAFFPMMFGYPGQFGRSGQNGGGSSGGGAIAVANSFSTGKGGVATSHATAYGDPSSFRNSNWKRKPQPED